ncbi:glycoside hydrolase family 26 protein [Pseudorhodoferax sp. Leaf274]|uniref:glycoside hydrolase family 26 protein n=1 Tax=Pseudorhodoferax sp. Leaf274 TaxID=1736318 RepID=UPI00138F99BD|nr:glycosyl hydrolase [Pseudorhodoferax sp. Leaf274]
MGLDPSRALPITSGATAQTVSLYQWLDTARQHYRYALGVNDHLAGMPAQNARPTLTGSLANFQAVTGRYPGVVGLEYQDPQWATRWGQDATDFLRDLIIGAHAKGSIIALHNHPGNPVRGAMSRAGQTSPAPSPSDPGYFGDRTGAPLAAIKTGGAQEAQFLAFLDRLATFLATLVDAKGRKIPVVVRMFHEVTGDWFWWNGVDRAADFIVVWRKMVDYLRTTKGVTNALYCWNVDASTGVDPQQFWPGPSYVDIVSMDTYDNRGSGDISLLGASGMPLKCWTAIVALSAAHGKPLCIPELGYQYGNNVTDIWDVKTGRYLPTAFFQSAFAAMWPAPYGPAVSDTAAVKASLSAMAASPYAMTAERLTCICG